MMIPSVVEVVAEREDIGVAEAPDKGEDAQTRSFQMRSSWASGRRKRSSQSGGDKGPPNREETNMVVADATDKADDAQMVDHTMLSAGATSSVRWYDCC